MSGGTAAHGLRGPGLGCPLTDERGEPCGSAVDPGAPVALCRHHLLLAHEWATREFGVTDLLPEPCRACGSRLGVRYPSGWLCAVCEWRVGEEPDGGAAPVRVDVVYYLRFRDRIKIGTSANPRQRFAALRYDELLAFERGGREVEQRRHTQFAARRLPRTEWFEEHAELAAHIATLRSGVVDPWSQRALWVSEVLALRE